MTVDEMRTLKTGDRVRWDKMGMVGTVYGPQSVLILWDRRIDSVPWEVNARDADRLTLLPAPQPSPSSERVDVFVLTKEIHRLQEQPEFSARFADTSSETLQQELKARHWRVGSKVGRTLYLNDKLVGMMDTPELATLAVEALNSPLSERERELLAALRKSVKPICWCEFDLPQEEPHTDDCITRSALLERFNGLT